MKHRHIVPLLLLLTVATCAQEDMFDQDRPAPWGQFPSLPHDMTMQPPVAGTVARNAPDVPVPQPAVITEAMLLRGQQRFNIDCVPCHGAAGDGQGMIVQRGFPKPPALFSDKLLTAKAQHFYDVITNGHGVMYSYADRVPSADRWAIVAYVRALQRTQREPVVSLNEQDKQHLQAAGP
jgi:mono/diheme cytochrome c family protein